MATILPNDIGSADALETEQHFFVNQSGLLKQDTLASLIALIQSNILVPVASGGTGVTTAEEALASLLPAQAGQEGKVLGTDGTAAAWVALPEAPPMALLTGTGLPEGVVTSPVGSLYVDTTGVGAVLWVKESGTGSTGWANK
ncbi:MAG: hypothetical protein JWO08_609 [Verrucomicrobiaceae bacterium]|nr:hypothetical protein [Verrucomicrobiaceae bacterium]